MCRAQSSELRRQNKLKKINETSVDKNSDELTLLRKENVTLKDTISKQQLEIEFLKRKNNNLAKKIRAVEDGI